MKYLSVCSGIEAATVAWHPLGFEPVAFAEVEPFPSAVLKHHYPTVPNWGDMTKFQEWPDANVDVLVGGTPCQSFSVAGLRAGLADPRGNLALAYTAIARRYRPRWVVWENVPGVLSSNSGLDFGSFLSGLVGWHVPVPEGGWQNTGIINSAPTPGSYGVAWGSLDAQYAGLAQRRKRVFVVGHLGDWRRAAAVLLERESLSWRPAPSRQSGQDVAATLTGGSDTSRNHGKRSGSDRDTLLASTGDISHCLNAGGMGRQDYETETLIAHSLRARANMAHRADADTLVLAHTLTGNGFDAGEDGTGRGTPLVAENVITLAIRGRGDSHDLECRHDGTANAILTPNGGRAGIGVGAIAYDLVGITDHGQDVGHNISPTVRKGGDGGGVQPCVAFGWQNSESQGDSCSEDVTPSLDKSKTPAVAFQTRGSNVSTGDVSGTFGTNADRASGGAPMAQTGMQVRRLTPRECERLQGFPDDYTLIPYGRPTKRKLEEDYIKYLMRGGTLTREECYSRAADGPRYKALGNSMAVPCMAWIGRRLKLVDALDVATNVAS